MNDPPQSLHTRSPHLAKIVFGVMLAVYFFASFQRTAIPGMIFDELQTDLRLSASSVVLMGSMFTWVYGGMQIVVGFLADRFGGARMFLLGGVVLLAGSVWFPLAGSTAALFTARTLTGFGASFIYLSIVNELGRLFCAQYFTVWLSVVMAVGHSGGMTATLPFERVVTAFGWRPALLRVAALLAVVLAIAGLVLRRFCESRRAGTPLPLTAGVSEIFRQRRNWPLIASNLIAFPLLSTVQTLLGKKLLQDVGGMSSPRAATSILMMTVTLTVCVVLGGILPQLFGKRRKPWVIAGAFMLLVGIGALLAGVVLRAPGWVFLLGCILLGTYCIGAPSNSTIMKELNRPEAVASAVSVVNSLAFIGSGLVGQASGCILGCYRDTATVTASGIVYPPAAYGAVLCFLVAVAVLNLVFTCLAPETRGRARTPGRQAPTCIC